MDLIVSVRFKFALSGHGERLKDEPVAATVAEDIQRQKWVPEMVKYPHEPDQVKFCILLRQVIHLLKAEHDLIVQPKLLCLS